MWYLVGISLQYTYTVQNCIGLIFLHTWSAVRKLIKLCVHAFTGPLARCVPWQVQGPWDSRSVVCWRGEGAHWPSTQQGKEGTMCSNVQLESFDAQVFWTLLLWVLQQFNIWYLRIFGMCHFRLLLSFVNQPWAQLVSYSYPRATSKQCTSKSCNFLVSYRHQAIASTVLLSNNPLPMALIQVRPWGRWSVHCWWGTGWVWEVRQTLLDVWGARCHTTLVYCKFVCTTSLC